MKEVFGFFLKKFLFMAALGLLCWAKAFSSCGKQGLPSSCGAWASHCRGFSCCGAWGPGTQASVVAACGLSCSEACDIFLDQGIKLMTPALAGGFLTTGPPGKSGVWFLDHCGGDKIIYVFQNGKNYTLKSVTFTVYTDYTAMNLALRRVLVPDS